MEVDYDSSNGNGNGNGQAQAQAQAQHKIQEKTLKVHPVSWLALLLSIVNCQFNTLTTITNPHHLSITHHITSHMT